MRREREKETVWGASATISRARGRCCRWQHRKPGPLWTDRTRGTSSSLTALDKLWALADTEWSLRSTLERV